ncbi:hypothetical protein NBRC116602_00020 [Hyphomicrobiales bacterium 4NK60-0047b]
MSEEPFPKYIFDEPSKSDEFESQSHKRSADCLIQILDSNASEKKIIGLEGEWGSGKSSIIDIAMKEIEGKYHIFNFDLSGQNQDLFKQGFLEKFVLWLGKTCGLSESSETLLKQIWGRENKISKDHRREYHITAIFFILLAPFLPIAYFILKNKLDNQIQNNGVVKENIFDFLIPYSEYSVSDFTLVITILSLPLIIFILKFIYSFLSKEVRDKIFMETEGLKCGDRFRECLLKHANFAISFINKKEKKVITNETITEQKISDYQFNSFIEQNVKRSNLKHDDHIIVVLDNLDRITSSSALQSVWTEFPNFRELSFNDECPSVSVIVPYDRQRLSTLLIETSSKDENTNGINRYIDTTKQLQKLFHPIIRVTPPLLSKWQKFYEGKLDDAFGDLVTDDLKFKLFRLMDYHLVETKQYVTPRYLISHINEMVTLSKQWKKEIPLECLSLFTLHRHLLLEDSSPIIDGSLLSEQNKILIGDIGWQKYVAALYFGAPADQAEELLFADEIRKGLVLDKTEDKNPLSVISKNDAFIPLLEGVVNEYRNEWAKSPKIFFNVCRNIDQLDDISKNNCTHVWRSMAQSVPFLGNYQDYETSIVEGQVCLINNLPSENSFQVAETIISSLNKIDGQDADNQVLDYYALGSSWIVAVDKVEGAIISKAKEAKIEKPLIKPRIMKNARFLCGVVDVFHQTEHLDFNHFIILSSNEEITEQLVTYINDNQLSGLNYGLEKLLTKKNLFSKDEVTREIANRLEKNIENETAALLAECLFILVNKTNEKSVVDIAKKLSNTGVFLNWFVKGFDDENDPLFIYVFAILLKINGFSFPQNANHPVFGDLNNYRNRAFAILLEQIERKDLLENICVQLEKFELFSKVFSKSFEGNEFFHSILRELVQRGKYFTLNTKDIILQWDEFVDVIGKELSLVFLIKFNDYAKYFKKHFSDQTEVLKIPSSFVSAASNYGNDLTEINELIEFQLTSNCDEDWGGWLSQPEDWVRLLIATIQVRKSFDLVAKKFKEPLLDHALKTIEGNISPSEFDEDWHLLPDALHRSTKKSFYKDLLIKFNSIIIDGDNFSKFVELYSEFWTEAPFVDYPKILIERIFKPLLETSKIEHLQYLLNYSECLTPAIKAADKKDTKELIDALEGAIGTSSEEEIKNKIIEISKCYKLNIKIKPVIETEEV